MVNKSVEIEAKTKKKFYTLKMVATAYTYLYDDYGNRTKTYTEIYPYFGVVAVDPKVIPLYSELHIEGYGKGKALDTGGAIKGNRIDVFFETYEEAIQWGRKTVEVRVYY